VARYLIDANLPRWFSLWSGGDCEFVHDLGADWSDTEIWNHAALNRLTIVSKDADFSARVLPGASGPSVIHIRVGNLNDGGVPSLPIGDLGRSLPRQRQLPPRASVSGPHREHRVVHVAIE
jgi:predicted nuclease of predicted toxin-antitoxin system